LIFSILASLGFMACEENISVTPEAKIHLDNSRFLQGYPLHFSADLTKDVETENFEFNWDLGDGVSVQGPAFDYVYQVPGTYTVRLTIVGETESETDERTLVIQPSLQLTGTYALDLDSPSGLSFGLNGETLWMLSDKPGGHIIETDRQGNTLRALNYFGDDLEGITFDGRDSTLWLVDESQGTIIHIDLKGTVLTSTWLAGVSDGSGLEGIALDSEHARIFAIKEKDYSALLIINDSLQVTSFKRFSFAPDYSGMYYSQTSDRLWLLSHEASSVYLTDTLGSLIKTYGFDLEQPEGLVFDELDSVFYIVDDQQDKLYHFKFWSSVELYK